MAVFVPQIILLGGRGTASTAEADYELWVRSLGLSGDFGAVLVLSFFINPIGASDQAWGAIATVRGLVPQP